MAASFFKSLNDIKPKMLREATAITRIAAEEFAYDAQIRVGGIQYAPKLGFRS